VALIVGWTSETKRIFDRALDDPITIPAAIEAINKLPSRLRRRVLSLFGALNFSKWPVPDRQPSEDAEVRLVHSVGFKGRGQLGGSNEIICGHRDATVVEIAGAGALP